MKWSHISLLTSKQDDKGKTHFDIITIQLDLLSLKTLCSSCLDLKACTMLSRKCIAGYPLEMINDMEKEDTSPVYFINPHACLSALVNPT
jgi:hypothetical protein